MVENLVLLTPAYTAFQARIALDLYRLAGCSRLPLLLLVLFELIVESFLHVVENRSE